MKRAVKKFLISVKYNVNLKSTEEFLKTLGYSVVFFGTRSGDAEIKRYELEYLSEVENAFTYCGQSKIVFINAALHANDKLLLLLHETGHILFGHLEKNKHLTRDDVKAEIEANAFAYNVTTGERTQFRVQLLSVSLMVFCTIFLAAFAMYAVFFKTEAPENNIADSINETVETHSIYNDAETSSSNEDTPVALSYETVYITKTGSKFHRSTCSALRSSSIPIDRDDAEESYTPCKLCNP